MHLFRELGFFRVNPCNSVMDKVRQSPVRSSLFGSGRFAWKEPEYGAEKGLKILKIDEKDVRQYVLRWRRL